MNIHSKKRIQLDKVLEDIPDESKRMLCRIKRIDSTSITGEEINSTTVLHLKTLAKWVGIKVEKSFKFKY